MWFKKTKAPLPWNPEKEVPVVRASICTGEKVAGFKDVSSGKFHEVQLIRTNRDFKEFLSLYGLDEASVRKEW